MDPLIVWIVIGVICAIIEIFTPGFLFLSIGVGAIITGILSKIITNVPLQILIFAIITFLLFISTRRWSKRLFSKTEETNIYALKGKKGFVVKEIPAEGRGYVKVGGEEWSAISEEGKKIEQNKNIIVSKVEGNKLIVLPAKEN